MLGAKGAIELILTAMHNHVGRATLQKNACAALWDLTFLKRAYPRDVWRCAWLHRALTMVVRVQARTSCAFLPAVVLSVSWTRCGTTLATTRCSKRPWESCSTSPCCVRAVARLPTPFAGVDAAFLAQPRVPPQTDHTPRLLSWLPSPLAPACACADAS